MCGGCGWKTGVYTCDTWVVDALKDVSLSAADLAAALQRSSVSTLSLSMCGIDGAGAVRLARALTGNTTAQTLDLGWNAIGDEGGLALAAALPASNLSRLDLRACSLGSATAERLCEAVRRSGAGGDDAAAGGRVVEVLIAGNSAIPAEQVAAIDAAVTRNVEEALCLRCGEIGHTVADVGWCSLADDDDADGSSAPFSGAAQQPPPLFATGLPWPSPFSGTGLPQPKRSQLPPAPPPTAPPQAATTAAAQGGAAAAAVAEDGGRVLLAALSDAMDADLLLDEIAIVANLQDFSPSPTGDHTSGGAEAPSRHFVVVEHKLASVQR
eukprot:COSAG01_NODE_3989_length_5461_cov_21.135660_2_plen_325_part_00